jgi:hypothetical protein
MPNRSKLLLYFYIPVSVLLLVYTTVRAYMLSLTIDEAHTFLTFVPMSFIDIIRYNNIVDANNHILNTLLIKLISHFFGNSELVLRIPNLIGHAIYLMASYFIVKKIKSPVIAVSGFLLLNFNPILLEFFSLARGYGLATGLTLMSVNFVLDYFLTKNKRAIALSFLFAFLAVLGNFSTLVYYAGILLIFSFQFVIEFRDVSKRKGIFMKYLPMLLFTLMLFYFSYEPITKLISHNALYIGGDTGFWYDTIGSLINCTWYNLYCNYTLAILSQVVIIIIVSCSAICLVLSVLKKDYSEKHNLSLIAFCLLIFPCIISICQHLLIGSKYMQHRMGLFLIPLFIVNIIFLADSINWKKAGMLLVSILAAILTFHTVQTANFKYTLIWQYDAQTKDAIKDIIAIHNENNKDINLGVYTFYEPAATYYKKRWNLSWLTITNTSNSQVPCDYYFIESMDDDKVDAKSKKVIKTYETSGAFLVK